MLRRLDRYVAATVLGAYAASLLFLVFLMVMFETLRGIGSYLETANELGLSTMRLVLMIGEYHLLNLPFLFVSVAPFVTVIACMFAVARLMAQNEITPMLFTGRSIFRVLLPAVLLAVVSGCGMAAVWEYVNPRYVDARDSLRALLETGRARDSVENIVLRIGSGKRGLLICTRYSRERQRMDEVKLFDPGTGPGDEIVVVAKAASWNPERTDWELTAGVEQAGDRRQPRTSLGVAEVTPELIWRAGKSAREADDLAYSELMDLRRLKPTRRDYALSYHRHFTFPLANLVLLLLALPFAVSFERGRRIERVIFAIAVCAAYLVADLTCQNAGFRGWLHPLVAAWAPTIVFGSLGAVFFSGMKT